MKLRDLVQLRWEIDGFPQELERVKNLEKVRRFKKKRVNNAASPHSGDVFFFVGGEGKNVYIILRKMYHFDEYILVMDFPKSSTTLSFLEGATHTFCSFWYGTIDLVLEFFTATSVVELGFFKDAEIQHLGCVKRTEEKCKLRA